MSLTDASGCGCPPTSTGGGVHHVILSVRDLARSRAAYGWLLSRLGYPGSTDAGGGVGWFGEGGSFWLKQADARFAADTFDKDRVGLCEVAFRAASRAHIDALARDLPAHGFSILDAPREYPYVTGYYAVFFADPDGIKLEAVHIPG